MKIVLALLALFLPMAVSPQGGAAPAAAPQQDPRPLYTVYSGFPKGSYNQVAEDMRRACPQLNIQVLPTGGSLDNVRALLEPQPLRVGYRFALIQGDVLAAQRSSLRPVLNMFPEDVSVLVSRASGARTLADLAGRRVAVGSAGSGAWFTAEALRRRLGVAWTPVERPYEEALLAVLTGELDAAVIVAAHPVRLLSEMGAVVQAHVSLLPVPPELLRPDYAPTRLAAGTYPWQTAPVDLVSVRSQLVAAADVPAHASQALAACVVAAQPELRRWGHPKWASAQISPLRP
jgi:TRAP transporter TAXI family solute receptor